MFIIKKNHKKFKLASDKNQSKTVWLMLQYKRHGTFPQCDWATGQQVDEKREQIGAKFEKKPNFFYIWK